MSQHSIIEHRANYFYVRLEDDYLVLCGKVNKEIEALDLPERTSSGPADCKAMILSILEHWMNSKRLNAKSEYDLYVYFTYDEWEQQLRYRYMRSTIIRCLKEMEQEGEWLDEQGEIHTGLIKKKHHVQNTYAYMLHLPVVQALITQLPEQSPFGPRAKAPLGRPTKKNRVKINDIKTDGINLNGLISNGINEIPSENTRNNEEYRSKINAPFYTQIEDTIAARTRTIPSSCALQTNASALSAHSSLSEQKENTDGDTWLRNTRSGNSIGHHSVDDGSGNHLGDVARGEQTIITQETTPSEQAAKPKRKPATPKPVLSAEEQALDERRKAWQEKINENRGGPLRKAGECINETNCIKALVAEFNDKQIAAILLYMQTEMFPYCKNPHKIGGRDILNESRPVAKLLKERREQTQQGKVTALTPSSRQPGKQLVVPSGWSAKPSPCLVGGVRS